MPVDGSYLTDVLPVDVLLGAGAGLSFPSLMTLAMSGATPERLRASPRGWSTPRSRSAARSGSRSWPRWPRAAPTPCSPPASRAASALTGGYHLAFIVGAGLVAVALLVAATVLRPEAAEAAEREERAGREVPAYAS